MDAWIEAVNVGVPRVVEWRGRPVRTAIWKSPVPGRVLVRGVNVSGDDQADRRVHGGPDMAVYAYSRADLDWWSERLASGGTPPEALGPGSFGENLTVSGLAVSDAVVGERWRVGTALLGVSQPRVPCYKLGIRMGDDDFPRRFAAAGRPGAYLRILEEGDVGAGDAVEVVHRPGHGVTVATVARIFHTDRSRAGARQLLDIPELAASWREWAAARVA